MDKQLDERVGLPSASNWRRLELCAGSFALEQEARRLGQDAYRSSPEAARGDRIHGWLAGEKVVLDEGEQASAGFLKERADEQVTRIFGEVPVTETREQRLWFKLGGVPVASGRFDRVVVGGRIALVQDYKAGFSEPDPAEINSQLKFLSVVVALEYPDVREVVAQIISGPYGVTETRYDIDALGAAYNQIVATLEAINDPHASFAPSVKACRYCPAVPICQATKDLIVPIAKLQCSALPDGERAAVLLEEVELLERHLKAIKEYYSGRLEADPSYQLPGWGMAPGPSRREVTDWGAARVRLGEFINPAELEALANYSIPAVEKLLAKSLKLKAREAGVKLAEILNGLLATKTGNLILKRVKSESKVEALNAQS